MRYIKGSRVMGHNVIHKKKKAHYSVLWHLVTSDPERIRKAELIIKPFSLSGFSIIKLFGWKKTEEAQKRRDDGKREKATCLLSDFLFFPIYTCMRTRVFKWGDAVLFHHSLLRLFFLLLASLTRPPPPFPSGFLSSLFLRRLRRPGLADCFVTAELLPAV